MCGRTLALMSFAAALILIEARPAQALPWDIDMYRQQSLQPNEVARNPVTGTVPVGSTPFRLTLDEADQQLKNPIPPTLHSGWRGQRLYNANCATCHGKKGDGQGPLGASKALPVPDLMQDLYKGRSDGRIFGTIHLGGAVMPRYGFKFSTTEHWDIVNYVRFLQGVKDIPGLPRPQ